ncbi:uncharacterized protein B0I36DRAFT_157560 [Microdochium trichocladiopsis]|uniref:Uncharacterized protein n=1 Tax=Microdochium trichocladiopsis TaxID=1682393 RepID=A0A9P9BMX9_9PEZI|nr:uncharacterized protein B0I36DRAFT_157560 [Microdochium trichocladiopsis]KAH7026366.1 hypothetical protein B0I36DRAFT_157560 [Microdochium trichocladiopsis]
MLRYKRSLHFKDLAQTELHETARRARKQVVTTCCVAVYLTLLNGRQNAQHQCIALCGARACTYQWPPLPYILDFHHLCPSHKSTYGNRHQRERVEHKAVSMDEQVLLGPCRLSSRLRLRLPMPFSVGEESLFGKMPIVIYCPMLKSPAVVVLTGRF